MSSAQGKFVWYDVMTTDTEAAEAFYKKVVGWEAKDSGMTERYYGIFSKDAAMVAGCMPIPDDAKAMGAKPAWMGYIGVDDVDDAARRVTAAGGKIMRPPADIPNVGRFAVAADPQGAGFMLFKGASDQQPAPVPPMKTGHVGWHELHAGDGKTAFDFYGNLFGWTKTTAMDMGPMGTYQMFSNGQMEGMGDGSVGGMMTKMPQTPMPHWLYYFAADAIDQAAARVKAAGGQVLNGPMEVPGGMWTIQCLDPQGAMFAMVGPKG